MLGVANLVDVDCSRNFGTEDASGERGNGVSMLKLSGMAMKVLRVSGCHLILSRYNRGCFINQFSLLS